MTDQDSTSSDSRLPPADPSAQRASSVPPGGGSSTGRRPGPGPVQYKGAELEPERGPGLGCFWLQVVLLAVLVVLTPLSVSLGWPSEASAVLLFVTIGLLFFVGQTMIFLLRIVAAERRGRRRPLASATPTVGEIEDATSSSPPHESPVAGTPASAPPPKDPPAAGTPANDPTAAATARAETALPAEDAPPPATLPPAGDAQTAARSDAPDDVRQ